MGIKENWFAIPDIWINTDNIIKKKKKQALIQTFSNSLLWKFK